MKPAICPARTQEDWYDRPGDSRTFRPGAIYRTPSMAMRMFEHAFPTEPTVKGGGKVDHVGGLTADIRLSLFRTPSLVIDTVAVEKCTSAAIHRFEVVLTGGGMDVPGGRVSTGPTGGDGGWDEHPGGLPCVRVAPCRQARLSPAGVSAGCDPGRLRAKTGPR